MNASLRNIALASAITVALAACGKPQQQQMPTPEVAVITATLEAAPLHRELVGRLSAYRTADVRARVAGVLQKRLYTEGSYVKAGQPLFQIDPAPLQAALSQAQGELASAQATYANAKVTADRYRKLIGQKFVSQSDLDSAEATERTSSAAVKEAQASVQTARINLGYSHVTAPISGRASKQEVTEGALVGSDDVTLLTTVDQIDPLYVNFSMSSDELSQLRSAQAKGDVELRGDGKATVDITLPDGSKYPEQGTLDFSDVNVDTSTGAVSLRAVLPNPDHTLLPGAFVSFTANLGELNKIFLIPTGAIQRDTQGAYALVVSKDGKVTRKNVTTDGLQNGKWIISSGLSAGDKVIVDGVQKVQDGATAKTVPYDPNAQKGQQGQEPGAPQGQQKAAAPSADEQKK